MRAFFGIVIYADWYIIAKYTPIITFCTDILIYVAIVLYSILQCLSAPHCVRTDSLSMKRFNGLSTLYTLLRYAPLFVLVPWSRHKYKEPLLPRGRYNRHLSHNLKHCKPKESSIYWRTWNDEFVWVHGWLWAWYI